jgi:hypothetical protein
LSVLPDDLAQAGIIIRYEEGVSDGYQVLVVRDDTNGDYVNLNGAILPLDNLQAGDSFGVRGTGSLAEAYYKPVGGSWALLGGGNDPNWLDAGYIAVSNSGNVGGAPAIDDVGGGAYVPGSCGNNTYLPYVITSTLQSGNTLSVPEQVSFGQIITGGIVVSLLAVFALDFIFRLVYRR